MCMSCFFLNGNPSISNGTSCDSCALIPFKNENELSKYPGKFTIEINDSGR